jgi:hypothetical protein
MTRSGCVSLSLLSGVLLASAAWAAESVRVTGDRVNLRSGPSTTSRIVGKVDRGAVLEVLGREGDWVRVAAPDTREPAYISARLCEPLAAPPASAPAAEAQPDREAPARPSPSRSATREPLRLGVHASWANEGIDFGLGARVSTGLPGIRDLGALFVFDYFFGVPSGEDVPGGEVSGHSIQLGVFPTYSFDLADARGYLGAGLSYLRTSVSASVTTPGVEVEASESASSTSLGVVAGAKFRNRFFGEARYHFGDADHLTVSLGVLFDRPW